MEIFRYKVLAVFSFPNPVRDSNEYVKVFSVGPWLWEEKLFLYHTRLRDMSLGVRGSRREPKPRLPLHSQVNYESPPPLGSAGWMDMRYCALGVTMCYVDVYFRKSFGSSGKLSHEVLQGGGFSGLTSSGQLLCDYYPGVGISAGCLVSV